MSTKKTVPSVNTHTDEKGNKVKLNVNKVNGLRKLCRAYDHPLRQKLLAHMNGGEATVTELYKRLRIEQSVCSQHLRILRDAYLVKTRRDGKEIYYSVSANGMATLNSAAYYV